MMLTSIRKSKIAKVTALVLAFELTAQWLYPIRALALTTGPSQPEMSSFEPIGTSEMVNIFSGDFTYNIPLLDVGGYPINMAYNSGISTDMEASWVGLGWNINPGAINRSMRGLPDDFNGDKVTKRFNMKPNRTYAASVAAGVEAFGVGLGGSLSYGIAINYNNYKGVGYEQSLNMSFTSGKPGKGSLTAGLGVTSGSEGLDLTPSLSFSKKVEKDDKTQLAGTGRIGLSINSRSGMRQLSLSASCAETNYFTTKKGKPAKSTRAINGGASISFASPAYTPMVNMPMVNTSLAFSAKLGTTIFALDGTVDITGSYSSQKLERNSQDVHAYGYLNSQNGETNDVAMLDFNREKDGAFTENTPSLPITNFTYDIYSVNGQGIGGTYRPFRSDLGHVFDAANRTYSVSANIGAEFGGGNLVKGGIDVSITDVNTTSGRWSQDNDATTDLYFKGTVSGDPLFEPYYFKEAGEKSVDSDPGLFTAIGGSKPIRVRLEHTTGLNVIAHDEFLYDNYSTPQNLPANNYRSARQKRNQAITTMSVSEASRYGLNKNFYASGISASAKAHHIGEITTLRSDGSRYVFGLPAYNTLQQEVTFNTQGRTTCAISGLVTYGSGDNSVNNALGIDNYFSETETPGYAHSFLLTAVLSPDYVDYDNTAGPSEGDLGSYTRLNYVKTASSFKWRTPLTTNSANYNEGLKSLPEDDKGSYVYGEKEIWYVSSIETKSYVAVFTLSDRNDGLGVTDKDGTINTATRLKKLDKITLYSKPDYNANGTNATPIKVVNFVYDYSLCDGIPNSSTNEGKLTLKEVYFTYGNSFKAKLSGYHFNYGKNYDYNPKANDRWGNYMRNPITNCTQAITDSLTTAEYPYVVQDATTAKNYGAAWSMTSIELPSGGTIEVNYEADDYAYVQDKRAGEMFKVTDFKVLTGSPSSGNGTINASITPKDLSIAVPAPENYGGNNFYLYFKLKNNLPTGTPATDLLAHYLGWQTSNIYFRFLSDITRYGDYEYVSGYFDVDYVNSSDPGVGLVTDNLSGGLSQYAWIRLKKVPIGDRDNSYMQQINPICKANWQFGRLQVPRKVWEQPDPQSSGIEQTVRAIANSNMAQNLIDFFKGPNRTIRDKAFGRRAMMNKSWIRLQNPDGFKYGGGIRVKSVVIKDNWKDMVNPTNNGTINSQLPSNYEAQYGQEYEYTTYDEANARYISSGVASWEPQPGGDENPFHEPVFFNEEKKLVPDDESYIEKPYGESFFPAPGIGYSKVTVRNYIPTTGSPDVTRHGTGHTVQEFYTAKDFPTITRVGWLDAQHWKTNPIFSLLRIKMKDYLTASQGFVVELNDMHGKPKAVKVYAEGQTEPLSEVKYFYKTQSGNAHQLDNEVYVLGKDGSLDVSTCGMDYDFIADMREQETKMVSAGANLNVASFLAAIVPLVVPTIIPSWSSEDTRFRSATTTKVINRYGILERTEARDAGSTATTENLAWDAETGEVLLTKTYTDFDDAVFNFNYPAHWSYDRMGQAYKNVGAAFTGVAISSGDAGITNANLYFVNGDEVSVELGSYWKRAWVCGATSTAVSLIDATGTAIPDNTGYSIKILRSGRRNMQALSVGTVTTRQNPLIDNVGSDGIYDVFDFTFADMDVLNASATEYAELWSVAQGKTSDTQCNCELGTIGTQFANLMGTLAIDGEIDESTGTPLLASGVYTHGYTADLNAVHSSPATVSWSAAGSGSSSSLEGVIYSPGNFDCIVNMDLPSGYNWTQVVGLSDFVPVSDSCDATTGDFTATASVSFMIGSATFLIQVPVTGNTDCFVVGNCGNTTTCGVQSGDTVNPYFHNILGNWRMLKSDLYLSDRTQTTGATNDNLDIRKDGVYETRDQSTGAIIDFQPFWLTNSGDDWLTSPTYWTWSQEVTKYTPFGNEVENKDALERYSAAVFGYNNTLPVAVAANTRQQDVGFDGFEDYAFLTADCRELHFSFFDSGISPDDSVAHTGLYSMKVAASTNVDMTRALAPSIATRGTLNCPYTITAGDLNGVFAPYTGGGARTFVLNYWVKETTTLGTPVFNYTNADVGITINGTPATLTLVQKSDMIEGWQQFQYTFTIASSASGAFVISLNNAGASAAWFDDIRIFPFEANMTSYVYHPINQRLTAQLDENNYATFYEYDEEGALVRVKKETERGIVTIKEARNNSAH